MRRRQLYKILSLLLILVFTVAALPRFIVEDANNDNKIELKDAVLTAQGIDSRNQNNNETMKACVSTMQVVAGIKHISASSGQGDDISFLNLCFLVSATGGEPFLIPTGRVSNPSIAYTSIIFSPVTEPPIRS